jgi:outer membrane protein TolC
VDLKIPVFDGFKTSSNIDGASKAAEAARLRYELARDSKRARVRDLRRRLTATAQQPALATRRAEISRERQRLADLSLQGQRGTLTQALTVRSESARDAQAAIDACADHVLLWATLQREIGQLAAALGSGAPPPEMPAEEEAP